MSFKFFIIYVMAERLFFFFLPNLKYIERSSTIRECNIHAIVKNL